MVICAVDASAHMDTRPEGELVQLEGGTGVKDLPLDLGSVRLAPGVSPRGGIKVKKCLHCSAHFLCVCAQHAAASICWTILLSTPLLRWEVRLLLLRHRHSAGGTESLCGRGVRRGPQGSAGPQSSMKCICGGDDHKQ